MSSPVRRWRAAIARTPLEPARPFPADLRPLVARLAGSAERPAYTTGPATRSALSAAGALGATTGTVVHLPQPPSTHAATIGVLAHELAHARYPISRPRFLLRAPVGGLDAEERSARAVGDRVRLVARAGLLDDLGSAASGGLGTIGGDAVGQAGRVLGERLPGVAGGTAEASGAAGRAGEVLTGAAGRAGEVLAGGAGGVGAAAASGVGEVSAGIVSALPVGGATAAGVADVAAQVARSAVADSVRETVTGVLRQAAPGTGLASAIGPLGGLAQGAAGDLTSAAAAVGTGVTDQLASGVAAAGQMVSGVAGAGAGAGLAASGQVASDLTAAGQAAGGLMTTASQAIQGLTGADLDRLTEALEERLLRQIERRGGRYAGVF